MWAAAHPAPSTCVPCKGPRPARPVYRGAVTAGTPVTSSDEVDVDFGRQLMEFLRVYDNLLKPVKGCSVVWDRKTLQVRGVSPACRRASGKRRAAGLAPLALTCPRFPDCRKALGMTWVGMRVPYSMWCGVARNAPGAA